MCEITDNESSITSSVPADDRFFRFGMLCLLGIHLMLTGFLTWWYSPTVDEVAQLPAGISVWRFGRTDLYRVNPPLVRVLAAAPILLLPHQENWSHAVVGSSRRCEWDVGEDFIRANGVESLWLFTISRWPSLIFSLIGLLVCGCWGRELFGSRGGLLAATLWCFSPSLIAHGALITNDVAATSLGLLAAWRFHFWLKSPDWRNTFLAGICLGLALSAKTYWVILLGLWPCVALVEFFIRSKVKDRSTQTPNLKLQLRWNHALKLAVILGLGLYLLNLCYGFVGTGMQLRDHEFFSRALAGSHRDLELNESGNRFRDLWLGSLPVPFPRDYVTGIDLQKHDLERPYSNYLLGEIKVGGWWYYYLVGVAVKTPITVWLLFVCGMAGVIQGGRVKELFVELLPLWLPALLLFVLVSHETGIQRHVRYILPVFPVIFLCAASCANFLLVRRSPFITVCLLGVVAGESLAAYPGSLSFQNVLATVLHPGKPVLIDSNLDWGQDLWRGVKWLRRHPECRPATILPVRAFPPSAIGVEFSTTPARDPGPGWHLISVHLLEANPNSYSPFRKLQPVGRVGTTFNIYYVEELKTE